MNEINDETIEKARHEADRCAPLAAEAEAEYRSLVREEPIVLARCLLKYKETEKTFQMARARALIDEEYAKLLERISKAQVKYLRFNKAFDAIIAWIRLATAWVYRESARMKAGL